MPIQGIVPVTSPGNKEWTPVPEDVYQVVVKDIVEKDVPVYQATDGSVETKYLMKYVILDEGESQGEMLTDFAAPKWFGGDTKKKFSPSRLVTIFKAIYGFYYPKTDVLDLSEPSTEMINDLIGKQIRVTVKVKDEKYNKITDYVSIKAELEIPADVKIEGVKKTAAPKAAAPVKPEPAKPEEEAEEVEEDIDRPLPWENKKEESED